MQRKLGLALAAGAAVSLFAGAASAQVAWRSGQEDERVVLDAATNAQALVQFSQKGERFVIGFSRPITQVERASLLSKGVRLLAPLGGDSYFGIVSGNLDAAGALAAAPVVSVRSIRLEWKMDDFIRQGRIMPWTVVREGGMEGISRKNPIVGTLVLLHPDVAQDARTIEMVEALGGEVRDMLDSVNIIVVEMPYANLARLAADNRVQWIETPRPIMSPVNNSNRALVGADIVHAAPYGLSGLGVSAFVYDAGTSSLTHPDLAGRVTKVDTASVGEHATHVTGTVGGNGTNNPNYKGMAPKATLLTASFEWTGGGVFLYENPGDVDADYGKAIQQHNADVANNSIGSNTESNGFPCEIQGNYGLTDTVIDAIVRGSKGRPFRVVWANGNERQGSRCDVEGYGDYYSIAPPATAKNHMTVGALNSNDDSMTWFSSWGPTDDGRMKPDISAPGCQSDGDNGVTSTSSGGGYSTMCGTSMASPTVCGLSALLLEDYRNQFPGLDDPRNSLLRIFFAQTAKDLGNAGPDYQFGYGSVRIKDAIDFMRTAQFQEGEMSQGEVHQIEVDVNPGESVLKVMLAWDDVPGTVNVNPALVNNLDLRVYDPNGVQHFPWTLDPLNPGAPATKNKANNIDNIEQVHVANPMAGKWKVEVVGTNIPQGPQPYSVAGSPALNVKYAAIGFPNGLPDMVAPSTATELDVKITAINQSIVPGTAMLHFRATGGSFTSIPLTHLGGASYKVTLPGTTCSQTPEYYFSVEATESGLVKNPANAPADLYTHDVIEFFTFFKDEMETDNGWVLGAPDDDATAGHWNRMDPEATLAQPGDDHTPAPGVACYITDGRAGSLNGEFDVDNGKTTLMTPRFDLAGATDVKLSYWRWYSNNTGLAPQSDIFVVDISNDDGVTWTNLETVGPTGPGTLGQQWVFAQFDPSTKITLTDKMRVRFVASDYGQGSIIEAAIDDMIVTGFRCVDTCRADIEGDGDLDVFDFLAFQGLYAVQDPIADWEGDGDWDVFDFLAFQGDFAKGCP